MSVEEDVPRITLNRPELLNALSIELSDLLIEVIGTAKKGTLAQVTHFYH